MNMFSKSVLTTIFAVAAIGVSSIAIAESQPVVVGAPMLLAANEMPSEGKVVSSIEAAGYTYMELSAGGKTFWIAAPVMKVKVGDNVRFSDAMVMKNFTSKSLKRTFDTILFVSAASVK